LAKREKGANIFAGHDITHAKRLKLIIWLIKVFKTIRLKDKTLFIAVYLMDKYCELKS